MASFQYKAITSSGEKIAGVITALDRSEVATMLRSKDYFPVSIDENIESKSRDLFDIFKRVNIKDIAVFCRQFYTMLNSGISIIQCLDILRQQFDNLKLRAVIGDMYELVQKGSSFSDSLRVHRDVFPELLINMVEAGELSGNLDIIMQRMADHYEKDTKLRHKVSSAMIYPTMLISISIIVVFFLVTFVMPTFVGMFASSGVELPLPTRILLGIAAFIKGYWYFEIAGLIVLVYVIRRILKSDAGRHGFDRLKLQLPIIGSVSTRIATSRFSRTMSTLLASGIPLLNGMEISARVIGNKVFEKAILQVREDVRKGFSLSGPIRRTGLFPPMVDSMIKIGEESGSLDDVLRRTADFYDEEVDVAVQKMMSMLEPIMLLFMAVIIGMVLVAMYLPIFDLMKTVQT